MESWRVMTMAPARRTLMLPLFDETRPATDSARPVSWNSGSSSGGNGGLSRILRVIVLRGYPLSIQ